VGSASWRIAHSGLVRLPWKGSNVGNSFEGSNPSSSAKPKPHTALSVRFYVSSGVCMRDLKDGKTWGGTYVLSRGREYLVECEWNETLYLVTRDQIPHPPPRQFIIGANLLA
jgi:hypothetical protein